jgi:hypothetical protein
MQHAGKDGAFQGKAEVASCGKPLDHCAAAALLPEPAEHHRGADALAAGRRKRASLQAGDQHRRLAEAGARAQQGVEPAVSFEVFDATERGEHTLNRALTVTPVLDDLQVAAVADEFDTEQHARSQWHRARRGMLRRFGSCFARPIVMAWHRIYARFSEVDALTS